MITIVRSPALNRVLLDANNTEIIIQSTNGDGYYFRALIYIDDVLFDEQGWSRKDSFTASKDLVKLYSDYFESTINTFQENSLIEQNHLKKKVNITVLEKSLDTEEIADEIQLPQFFIMYNATPIDFDDSTKVQILGISPPVLLVPIYGKLIVPFYAKAESQSVTVHLHDNLGNLINSQASEPYSGKKVFIYYFDINSVVLVKDALYFELKIICGLKDETKIYKLLRFPDFPVKELYFKNVFGYYIPAYFDGEFENQDSFTIDTYPATDGSNIIFEINEEGTYTINTGSLLQNERSIVNQIATSHEVLFKINNQWKKIQTTTKKILAHRDKKHLYAQDLVFSFIKNDKVSNYYESEGLTDWDGQDFSPIDWLT